MVFSFFFCLKLHEENTVRRLFFLLRNTNIVFEYQPVNTSTSNWKQKLKPSTKKSMKNPWNLETADTLFSRCHYFSSTLSFKSFALFASLSSVFHESFFAIFLVPSIWQAKETRNGSEWSKKSATLCGTNGDHLHKQSRHFYLPSVFLRRHRKPGTTLHSGNRGGRRETIVHRCLLAISGIDRGKSCQWISFRVLVLWRRVHEAQTTSLGGEKQAKQTRGLLNQERKKSTHDNVRLQRHYYRRAFRASMNFLQVRREKIVCEFFMFLIHARGKLRGKTANVLQKFTFNESFIWNFPNEKNFETFGSVEKALTDSNLHCQCKFYSSLIEFYHKNERNEWENSLQTVFLPLSCCYFLCCSNGLSYIHQKQWTKNLFIVILTRFLVASPFLVRKNFFVRQF
jgi:hypothetical protein